MMIQFAQFHTGGLLVRMTSARLRYLVVAAWILALGCYGNRHEAEVSGHVTLDGNSIGPGSVVFAPDGGKRNPAIGAIQPDGSYMLKTSRDVGLPPGKYQVSLQIVELPTNLAPGERDMRPTKSRIPAKYTDTTTSGFEFEVKPGSNTIDLPLISQ